MVHSKGSPGTVGTCCALSASKSPERVNSFCFGCVNAGDNMVNAQASRSQARLPPCGSGAGGHRRSSAAAGDNARWGNRGCVRCGRELTRRLPSKGLSLRMVSTHENGEHPASEGGGAVLTGDVALRRPGSGGCGQADVPGGSLGVTSGGDQDVQGYRRVGQQPATGSGSHRRS